MLTEKEAQDIFKNFVELKNLADGDKTYITKLKRQENFMMREFKYIIESKTAKYKKHSNYDDLNQDGYEALLMGIKTYSPDKGSIFWWLHKYIGTKVSRSANMHSVVRSSIKRSSQGDIPKCDNSPINLVDKTTPFDILNQMETEKIVKEKLSKLSKEDYDLITNVYKMSNDDAEEIKASKVSNKLAKILRKLRKK